MNVETIQTYLPTSHQKSAAAVLAVLAALWILRLLHKGILREDHALLWIIALVCLSLAVFVDPVLVTIASLLGTVVPASALILLGLFFLFTICIWMTCIVSGHERRIANLSIEISIQRFYMTELQAAQNKQDKK